jgi:hypothetical protein
VNAKVSQFATYPISLLALLNLLALRLNLLALLLAVFPALYSLSFRPSTRCPPRLPHTARLSKSPSRPAALDLVRLPVGNVTMKPAVPTMHATLALICARAAAAGISATCLGL